MAISTFSLVTWTIIIWSSINVVSGAIQLDFRVTPAVVKPLETTNVTLQCLVDEVTTNHDNTTSRIYVSDALGQSVTSSISPPKGMKSDIAMIRILKNLQSQWQAIAQISSIAPTFVHKLDSSVSSFNGVISNDPTHRSFIQVEWDLATSDAFGAYRCDTITFDSQQNAILTTSSQLSLGSSLNALDFLRFLKHEMTNVQETINQQRQDQRSDHNISELLRSELQTLKEETTDKQQELEEKLSQLDDLLRVKFEKTEKRFDDLGNELANRTEQIGSKINMVVDSGFFLLWPRGAYGMFQPQSGCPVGGGASWQTSWIRHHTESIDRNKDQLSAWTHLPLPVLGKSGPNNYLYQRFCVKTNGTFGPNWPTGSYCINKKYNCPSRFNEGYIRWTEEENNSIRDTSIILPDMNFIGSTTKVSYCCRQDGPADVPIFLPKSDPFYLYRYGGKCQQVHGMKVNEEFIVFDTVNRDNRDEFGKVHPDGTINNVRLELCYYQRI